PHPPRPAPLHRREGLDHRRRHQPHRRVTPRRRLHRGRHPAHPGGDHPRPQGGGRPRQPRGGRHRQVRRAPPVLEEGSLTMPFAPIEEAIEAFARGEILVVVDDEDRENEGDLIMAAEFVTPEKVAFFLHHTSGYLCAPITEERAKELDLPLMVQSNTESQRTAFLVTVDYRHGTTTGISSHDRCATVRALCNPDTRPGDLARPGHINPLMGREGGVLKRAGHTEATLDLCRLAGLYPAGLLCEIVDEDKRDMARVPELERFAEEHGLLMISIADLIRYRRQTEKLVRRIAEARIPTTWGDFTAYVYESVLDGEQHMALVRGTVSGEDDVLVRVHSECLTGDVFGSLRCDCGVQLDSAMQLIAEEGRGVVVYLRGHEGRGIGLGHK